MQRNSHMKKILNTKMIEYMQKIIWKQIWLLQGLPLKKANGGLCLRKKGEKLYVYSTFEPYSL